MEDVLDMFDSKTNESIFVGYPTRSKAYQIYNKRIQKVGESKAYRIYNKRAQKLEESIYIKFDEGILPKEKYPLEDEK